MERGFGVQRRSGLVAEQHLGVAGQRPGNAHALFLPTGNLCRIAIGQMIQAHQLQQRRHALVDLVLGNTGQLQRQGHVVIHGARRQQVEVLEHHADVAARARSSASDSCMRSRPLTMTLPSEGG
jgi:hypothetical protein